MELLSFPAGVCLRQKDRFHHVLVVAHSLFYTRWACFLTIQKYNGTIEPGTVLLCLWDGGVGVKSSFVA